MPLKYPTEGKKDPRYEEAMRVFSDLKEVRERYEDVWEEINDLVMPRRSDFDWVKNKGNKRESKRKIYDPLPGYLARKAADGLLGNTVSRGNMWFRIHAQDEKLDKMRAFRLYVEEVEHVLYSLLRKSTLYEAAHDGTMDALTVGHCVLFREIDENTGKIIYTARHPKEVYIAENRWGKVDTVVRKFFMPQREVVKEFDKDGLLPDNFKLNASKDQYELTPVIHVVRPREDRDLTKADKWNMPFESNYVLEEHGVCIRESGFRRFPYPAIWRWRTNTGEAYGRSPSWDSLPDIKRLQEVARTMTHFVQQAVDPPLTYPLEMKGKIDRRPSGMTPYTDPSRRVGRLYDQGGAYPLGQDLIRIMREQLYEAYYADVFTILSQNMDRDKTATEVMEITGERTALLAAVSERFTSEFATPVIADLYQTAEELGLLPEMPEVLARYDLSVDLEFLGPLAQNQRRYYQSTGINAGLTQFATSAQMWPEILDIVNPENLARSQARASGFPELSLRSAQEVAQIRNAREQAMQQQQEAAMMQQQASAYAQTQKAPEKGSPGEGMV